VVQGFEVGDVVEWLALVGRVILGDELLDDDSLNAGATEQAAEQG